MNMGLSIRVLTGVPLRWVCTVLVTVLLWLVVSDVQQVEHALTVPLVWDVLPGEGLTVDAPETVHVIIAGRRREIRRWLAETVPALHQQAATQQGMYRVKVNRFNLLLPRYLQLVDYTPIFYRII